MVIVMNIKLKVTSTDKQLNLSSALADSVISVVGNQLIPQNGVKINISTQLFDENDCEIFENDIICDSTGTKFKIEYNNGAFFATKISSSAQSESLPLYFLQLNGHLPVIVINNN